MSGSFELYDDGPPPTEEPPGEQEPGEIGGDSGFPLYVMTFHRTVDSGVVEEHQLPIASLPGVSADEVATTLIPLYENAGWVFEHLTVTTQHTETYDPRD